MKQSKKITIYTTHCDDQNFYCRVHIAHYFSEGKQLKINGSPSELNRQGRDRRGRPIGDVAIYNTAPPSIFICYKRRAWWMASYKLHRPINDVASIILYTSSLLKKVLKVSWKVLFSATCLYSVNSSLALYYLT